MESGSPEPSRPQGATPATGTADALPAPARAPGRASHAIHVVDDQGVTVDTSRLRRLAAHVLTRLRVPAELELTVSYVDRARIAELNEVHLGGTGPTDVLAFPIDAPDDVTAGVPGLLGDVVVCPEVAAAQAGDHGRTLDGELDLLLVHGILHLLGHDHADPEARSVMFGLTDALLHEFARRRSRLP